MRWLIPILDIMKAKNLHTTFFVTGKWASIHSDELRLIAQQGHEVFNHTYDHPYLTQVSDGQIQDELQSTDQLISTVTGKTTKPFFRPPYGDRNSHVLSVAKKAGYRSVYWTTDALDWKESTGISDQEVKDRIISNLKPGAIILMHIGDSITGRVLEEVITTIQQKGYTIVPLSQGL